jgi:hypothetical protein
MKYDDKRAIALWRMSILGPLVSARLEHGDRRAHYETIAKRTHQLPDGEFVKISPRTIEAWYDAFRHGGFEALFPKDRNDAGRSRAIRPEVVEAILKAKREKPRRSIRRIIRMLERARIVRVGELTKSSVHRMLKVHGASSRPLRGPATERRSFLHEHAGDLWVGDSLHGPIVIAPDGVLRKAYLLSQIDGATRYLPHSFFAISESAADQEYGLKQAILKHGPPRAYYVDLGSAYIAGRRRCREEEGATSRGERRSCRAPVRRSASVVVPIGVDGAHRRRANDTGGRRWSHDRVVGDDPREATTDLGDGRPSERGGHARGRCARVSHCCGSPGYRA